MKTFLYTSQHQISITQKERDLFLEENPFAKISGEAFGTGSGAAGWFAGISGGRRTVCRNGKGLPKRYTGSPFGGASVLSAAARSFGERFGLPVLAPIRSACFPAPPVLPPVPSLLQFQQLSFSQHYIYLSSSSGQSRSTILLCAKALTLSHSIVETQKLEDLPFFPTKSKSLW